MSLRINGDCTQVVLTYGWVRSTYAALVNLTVHGIKCAVGDSRKVGMCQFSHHIRRFVRYPDPQKNENGFIEQLNDFVRANNIKMLLPSHDETVVIARHANVFPQSCRIPLPPVSLLEMANDKSTMQEFAERHGIATAKRISYTTTEELETRLDQSPVVPLVVRLRKGNSAKGVFYPENPVACYATVKRLVGQFKLTSDRLPVVQEYVHGEGWGVSCLYWEGKRIAHFTHRRLREKTCTGGTSTLREHQPNPMLEEMAFVLLDKLEWHGLVMVEFKYNQLSRQGWFIEFNPRLWGSIHLAISAGVEFPYLLFLCATKGPAEALAYQNSRTLKFPWRARWYLGDLMRAGSSLARGKFGEGFRLMMPGGADTFDDWNWRDPGAFAGEVLHYGIGFIRSGSINPVEQGMLG